VSRTPFQRTTARAALDRETSWMTKANCRGVDPSLFFPGRGEPTGPAKEVCARCVVRENCLQYALARPSLKHGVWGGRSENERRELRRQRSHVLREPPIEGAA
jgi:WhiB family redox-sensing transcriptional regulator